MVSERIYFSKNVLVRKEHFGTLIFLRNGERYIIKNTFFDILKYIYINNRSPIINGTNLKFISELKTKNIITSNKLESGNIKMIENKYISDDCLSFPRTIYWECTNKCNYRCLHCYSSSGLSCDRELSFTSVKKLIDELVKKGTEFLSIGGGEPLLYPHIYRTIDYANKKGLTIEVTTNGSLLNKDTILKLKKSGLNFLQVSLDGISRKTYEKIRFGGTLSLVLKNIEAEAKEFILSLCTVVNKLNINEIPKIIDYSKKIGAKHYRVLPLMNIGRGKNIQLLNLSAHEWRKLNRYLSFRRKKEKKINIQMNENLVLPNKTNITWLPSGHFGCSAGRTTCGIDAKGNVYPCSFMELPELNCGNITKQSLNNIWRKSPVLIKMRVLDHLNGKCGKCKYLSTCRGGCRAAAYLQNNKMDDSDKLCSIKI